ncbi:MAG: hypothetical protein LBH43_07785, partial [Treponema sp.]|nr:hypothetical protein [Treponema sp.]
MVKILTVICAALAFCTCASSGGVDTGQSLSLSADSFWLTLPGPGALVIIGASGRQLKKETEIELAREDAARKAAMYHGLEASFVSVQNIGANIFDYYTGTELELEYDRELEKYMDRLVYDKNRDVMRSDRGVFIRFAYPAFFPGNISYEFGRNRDGSPEWTSRPPEEISGFMAG